MFESRATNNQKTNAFDNPEKPFRITKMVPLFYVTPINFFPPSLSRKILPSNPIENIFSARWAAKAFHFLFKNKLFLRFF